jgi:hypothetical protein
MPFASCLLAVAFGFMWPQILSFMHRGKTDSFCTHRPTFAGSRDEMALHSLYGFQIIIAVHFIHSLIYIHSMDPYLARKPVDIEIVNDKQEELHQ